MEHPLALTGAFVAFRIEGGSRTVLNGINLTINQGEWLAVVGKNGSGKSTLLQVLAGLLPLSKGNFNKGWSTSERIGLVIQNPEAQVIGETVREDLYFSLENAAVDPADMPIMVRETLERIGLAKFIDWPVTRLSAGQKQLLAAAGCFAAGARVLLFDEAASMLDAQSAERLFNAVKDIHKAGATIIWITQRTEELQFADRVLALDNGKAVFLGSPQGFFYGDDDRLGNGEASVLTQSPCEQIGLDAPYAVQTARRLVSKGISLTCKPITSAEFANDPALSACFVQRSC